MAKIVTFGEIMQRLAPEQNNRFTQAERFIVTYAGGEANVAVSLAQFGQEAKFVTKLPEHEIGQAALNSVRKFGVDTSGIVRGGSDLGSYYVEKGASQRPSKVIYRRSGSAIALAEPSDFHWDTLLSGADWFHFTGITPALGGKLPEICLEALEYCKKHRIFVSCDLNYRKNLWSKEEAGAVMGKLMPYVNLCIANEEDSADVFGIVARDTDLTTGKVNHSGYEQVAQELKQRFGFDYVAITLRSSLSASDNLWQAMLFDGNDCFFSRSYAIHIVDRVGGGDSFGAGLIYALLEKQPPQKAIEFATASSCLKHSIEGDFNLVSVDEVWKLAEGNGSGRVER